MIVVIHSPDRRHCDHRPPESFRNAFEPGSSLILLSEVCQTGKHKNAQREEHHEQTELLVASLERVSERLESGGVSSQFQDPEYPHDPEQLHDPANVLELFRSLAVLVEAQSHVVRKNRQQVDAVERAFEEYPFFR